MNKLFKALSDPSRRKMLELLVDADMSAGEIADYFNMTKPSISHHLNVLKEAELILSEKQGTSIIYSLNTTVFQEAIKWLFEISKKG